MLSYCKPAEELDNCENPNLSFLINENFTEDNPIDYDALILNEGGYTYGNASVNTWSTSGAHAQNIFNSVNNYNIGDVLQSAYKTDNEIYLIVNNSQKIEVLDIDNLQRKRSILGFTSPRYMTIINSIALVTDLYANQINVFNTETHCEMNSIAMQGWTEQIFYINNRIYVIERSEVGAATQFANLVAIEMDITNDNYNFNIIKRTSITIEPSSVVVDGFDNIWILSDGKISDNIYPTLTKFSTLSNTIEKTKTYNSTNEIPERIYSNTAMTTQNLFYSANQKIYKLKDVSDQNDFYTVELFNHSAQNLYNFSYVADNNTFLICDAKDYISAGEVLNYSSTGTLLETISAGVVPNFILFK